MSLVEAAAALDRLLRGHREEGAALNIPPSVSSLPPTPSLHTTDDGNLLPTFFPNTLSTKDAIISHALTESPVTSMILPWDNLPAITLEEEPTAFTTAFSSLPSPIPLSASPTLPAIPSPFFPPHWVASLDQLPSIEDDIFGMDILPKSPWSCEDVRKRRRRRRTTRGNLEDLEGIDENFVPLDPEKYKTELCRSFQVYSYCRCNYAHGLQELRGASRHGKYKTRNCQSYHQTGSCRYGARCSFIHEPEEGVLKCSIANKEVLEALHYRPTAEDIPRTANITWRFLETLGESASELHFISSTVPSRELSTNYIVASADVPEDIMSSVSPFQSHINFLISSEDSVFDESRLLTYSIPIGNNTNVFNSTGLLQENLDLLLSLQVGDESNKSEPLEISEHKLNSSYSLLDTIVDDQVQTSGRSCGALSHKISLGESACNLPWSTSPVKSPRIQELDDEEEDEEVHTIVKRATGIIPVNNICQDLKDMEVVHSILKRAPIYSATVWSDGTDNRPLQATTILNISTQPTEDNGIDDKSFVEHVQENENHIHNNGVSKRKNRKFSRRKRKAFQNKSSKDSESSQLSKDEQIQSLTDDVFSSTLQSDSESDDEVSTRAAGPDGDEWSEKSSLHLADLLRSLHFREGNNQLLPWSKSGRRYSSDGSSIGLMSTKEVHSSPSSPASPRQHDMTKYKTELCRSFQYNGYCGYGDACLYAHGPMDLRSYPKHPMYRTKQCFSFHNKGFCLYGSRCQFLHDLE